MAKLHKLLDSNATCDEDAVEIVLAFHCPGCKSGHSFCIKSSIPGRPVWQWNGDMERPTFAPSLLINQSRPESRCHLFMRDGIIEFLGDCHHALKGQHVPFEEF